jgi:hypothetical protein
MNLKKLVSYLRINLLGPGPRLIKKKYLSGRGLTEVEKHWTRRSVNQFLRMTFYLLQLSFHPVAVVGRLVKMGTRQNKRSNNTQNNTKTQNTQNRKQKNIYKKNIKNIIRANFMFE